jgi:hypothetical protein
MRAPSFTSRARALTMTAACQRSPIDLSNFDPDMDHTELRGRVRCSVCGTIDPRKVLLIPQTDRQMRQGRQR